MIYAAETQVAFRRDTVLTGYVFDKMGKTYKSNKMGCVPQCTRRAVKGEVSLHSFACDERMK